jgi:NitT/TauT family transport system permease protein
VNRWVSPGLWAAIVVIGIWSLISLLGVVPELFLPRPAAILAEAVRTTLDGSLIRNLAASSLRIASAFALSVLVAAPASWLILRSHRYGRGAEAVVNFLRYIPVPAIIPLSIVLFGVGEAEKLFVLQFGTAFQLTVLAVDALRRIPSEYFDLFFTLNLKRGEIRRHVFSAAAPDLWDICRVTIGWCWSYVVLAELIAADDGVGHAIELARRYSNTAGLYMWMILLALVGLATDFAFQRAAKWMFRYRNPAMPVHRDRAA